MTEFTVLIDRIIGMALLQTKANHFQILPSMGHLDQNIYGQEVFQIQKYTTDNLGVLKGITNGRITLTYIYKVYFIILQDLSFK
jgi:hypothetical protein